MTKSKIGTYLITFVLGAVLMFFLMRTTKEDVKVPITIEVPIPKIEAEFDTLFNPKPLPPLSPLRERIIDSTYYEEYIKLKDSIAKDSMFKEAITIREYRPRFEDDSIKIDVYSKVRGTLLENQISYEVKERSVKIDTVLTIPIPKQAEFYGGADTFIPYGDSPLKPAIVPTIDYVNKSHTLIYNVGVDPFNKAVKGGIRIRF